MSRRYRVAIQHPKDPNYNRVKKSYVSNIQGAGEYNIRLTQDTQCAAEFRKQEYAEGLIIKLIEKGFTQDGWNVGIEILELSGNVRNFHEDTRRIMP
jgi:hypothetical protein